uniref:hypothetical protein n=1 Tax=Fulvivirga sp. TaxID=1931237 RepID=UPI00404A4A7A
MASQLTEPLQDLLSVSKGEQIRLYNYKTFETEVSVGDFNETVLTSQFNFQELWSTACAIHSDSLQINLVKFRFEEFTHFFKIINEEYLIHLVSKTKQINAGKVAAVLGLAKSKLESLV